MQSRSYIQLYCYLRCNKSSLDSRDLGVTARVGLFWCLEAAASPLPTLLSMSLVPITVQLLSCVQLC